MFDYKQEPAHELSACLVGCEMSIRDRALTIWIIANGNAQPQETNSQLQGRVFGEGDDAQENTVFTQYKKCSFGAQDSQPATACLL